jgi:hypothetical protein
MLPVSAALLQAAVEYGIASSSASRAAGGSTIAGDPLDNLLAALLGPPGMIVFGGLVLWLLLRKSGGSSQPGGMLGSALIAAIGLGAAYVIARWRHLL